MTIHDIQQGIIHSLQQQFPDIPVLTELPGEDFIPPGLQVKLFPVEQTREMGRRYRRSHSFEVLYYSSPDESDVEKLDIAERLFAGLEYIEAAGELIRGGQFRQEIVEGVLHFYGSYSFHVMKVKPESVQMQTLNQEGFIRNG